MTLISVEVLKVGSLRAAGIIKVVHGVRARTGGVMGTTGVYQRALLVLLIPTFRHTGAPDCVGASGGIERTLDHRLTAATHSITLARLLQVLVSSVDLCNF